MKKSDYMTILMAVLLVLLTGITAALAQQSAYNAGTTAASVTVGPQPGRTTLTAVSAKSDKADAVILVQARTGSPRNPTAAPTNGATVVAVVNTGFWLTNDHVVVYAHANGVLDTRTIAGATTSNVTLNAGVSQAGSAGDRLFKMADAWKIDLGAAAKSETGDIYFSPGDSPIVVSTTGTGACFVAVSTR